MSRALPWIVVCVGLTARVGLWAVNPPGNAYDDHLSVVQRYATRLERPAPEDCWQCYQPPTYYVLAAGALHTFQPLVADDAAAWKSAQAISTFASCLTLLLCWSVLRQMNWPGHLFALTVIALLPRELYTSAMASNDALLVFWVSLAMWGAWQFRSQARVCRGWAPVGALALGCAGAAFTKQSGLVTACLPIWLLAESTWLRFGRHRNWSLRSYEAALLVFVLVVMPVDELWRTIETGHVLVSNQDIHGSPTDQLPGERSAVAFGDFRVVALAQAPRLSDATASSFWTQLYARLWTDYEPRYFPPTTMTRWLSRAMLAAGVLPTLLCLIGLGHILVDRAQRIRHGPLLLMWIGFLAVPILQTLRFPYYSSMKAMFVLPAILVFGMCTAHGAAVAWRTPRVRIPLLIVASAGALIGILHIVVLLIVVARGVSGISGPIWPLPGSG